jgi:RND family efflux transporter MFP subunit
VAAAIEREVAAGQTFVGTVMPLKRAVVGSAVDGRVVELAAEAGQRVAEGQKLAQLLTETIQLELKAARAELDLRRQQLAELENGSLPEEIDQAKQRMEAAKARMQYAQTRRQRYESLEGQGGVVSLEDLDEARAAADQAEPLYREAVAAYQLVVKGPRDEAIAQARAQVAMQEALVEQIEDRLRKHTIVSRFAGYVVTEHTEAGQWLKRGDPVVELAALDEVEVLAYVVEQQVPYIKLGMLARVQVPGLPDPEGSMLEGEVVAIVPQADLRARTFPVRLRVKNSYDEDGPLLKSGMSARVTLPVGPRQKAVMVPKDALVLGGPSPMVFVVDAQVGGQGKVRPVPVDLGVAAPNLIQVKGDIQAGQMVVVEGNERLRPGQAVMVSRALKSEVGASSQPE